MAIPGNSLGSGTGERSLKSCVIPMAWGAKSRLLHHKTGLQSCVLPKVKQFGYSLRFESKNKG